MMNKKKQALRLIRQQQLQERRELLLAEREWDIMLPEEPVTVFNGPVANARNWGFDYLTKGLSKFEMKSPVTINVADTGALSANKYLQHLDTELAKDYTDGRDGLLDGHDHFSHCQGIIGATKEGIGVLWHPLLRQHFSQFLQFGSRVLLNGGAGSYEWVERYANAMADLYTKNPRIKDKPFILSWSFGGSGSHQGVADAVNYLEDLGIFVVSSAGNNGVSVGFPARLAPVFASAAFDSGENRASFSGRGQELSFCAPGVQILSCGADQDELLYMNGTSMSGPGNAAMLALLLAQNPDLTPKEVRALLEAGDLTKDLGNAGFDDLYGWGATTAGTVLDEPADVPDNPDEPGDGPGDEPGNPEAPIDKKPFKERQHAFELEVEALIVYSRMNQRARAEMGLSDEPFEFMLDSPEGANILSRQAAEFARLDAIEMKVTSKRAGEAISAYLLEYAEGYYQNRGFGLPYLVDIKYILGVAGYFLLLDLFKNKRDLFNEITNVRFLGWEGESYSGIMHRAPVWERGTTPYLSTIEEFTTAFEQQFGLRLPVPNGGAYVDGGERIISKR